MLFRSGDPSAVLRELFTHQGAGGSSEVARDLWDRAARWLDRQAADPKDLHPRTSAIGLDADGTALLAQVDQAIAARVEALTGQVLMDRPEWLTALGPEPSAPAARQAWLDALVASAARLDRAPDPASRPTLATTPPPTTATR